MALIHTLKELKNFRKTGVPYDSKSSAWKKSFETLRKKCDRVPTGASASAKTSNLITLSDEALLAEWEKACRDITTGPEFTHRGWCHAPYADGMRGQKVMAVKRGPQSEATLGSRVLRTWRSARAKNLIPRQPSHSCSPSLDLLTKKPPVLSGSRLQHN